MENPFFIMDQKFSSIENLLLELFKKFQGAEVISGQEKPINIEEASAFLNIPVNTIYSLTSRRGIPFFKKGKHLFFYKSELNEWVKEGRQLVMPAIQPQTRKGVRRG